MRNRDYFLYVGMMLLSSSCADIPDTTKPAISDFDFNVEIRDKNINYRSGEEILEMYMELFDRYNNASYEIIGQSLEGRDIWLFKVGNDVVNSGKVMVDGSTHGMEDSGPELCFLFAEWLLESNDSLAIDILQNNLFIIIPILNIDNFGQARQNKRRNYQIDERKIEVPFGVDLNRNAPSGFGSSGSYDPNNDYEYRGLYGGSEPETNAYVKALDLYQPDIYVNSHTGNEYLSNKNPFSKKDMFNDVMDYYDLFRKKYDIEYRYRVVDRIQGGMITHEAWSKNASAWLVEFVHWDHLPKNYLDFREIWFQRAFPFFLAISYASR